MIEQQIEVLLSEGKDDEAIEILQKYLEQEHGHEAMLLKLGELIYAKGNMTEALNKFNAVLRLNPDNSKAKNYVAMIHGILNYFCKDLLNP